MRFRNPIVLFVVITAILAISAFSSNPERNIAQKATMYPTFFETQETDGIFKLGFSNDPYPTGPESLKKEKNALARVDNPRYFKTFLDAVALADLTEFFENEEPITVFVPLESAFSKMSPDSLAGILDDPEQLRNFLMAHVVQGEITSEQLHCSSSVRTVGGVELAVEADSKRITVGGAAIVIADISADNGIIHVVNQVVVPSMEVARK